MATGEDKKCDAASSEVRRAEFQLTHCYGFIPIELTVSDLAQQDARTTLLAQEKCLALEVRSYSCSLATRSWMKIARAHSRLPVQHSLASAQGLCRHGSNRRQVLLISFFQVAAPFEED
jgi:hypothetical protein